MNETGTRAGSIATTPPSAREPVSLSWAKPHGLISLSFINFLLRILTLGVYHFWGKTEVRKHIWSAIRLNGEPLEYIGTGKELFLGFLVVFTVVLLPTTLLTLAAVLTFGPQSSLLMVFQVSLYLAFFFLLGVGIHRAQRYRLSRTRWRGIRGGLEGNSSSYAWVHFWTALLIPLTLGWVMPWRSTKLQGLISNGIRFGDRPFHFRATSGPLYARFAVLWVGSIVIFVAAYGLVIAGIAALIRNPEIAGRDPVRIQLMFFVAILAIFVMGFLFYAIVGAWYRAGMVNHFAAHTEFGGATFTGHATAGSLIWLSISNYLLVLLTFGLLAPVAQARSAAYFIERLSISGDIPFAAIAQRGEDTISRGEGLAQAFDVDAF